MDLLWGWYGSAEWISTPRAGRRPSPANLRLRYGKWYGEILTEENKKQFLIPKGFAHGFLVLSDTAEFCYKCDDFYHPNDEGGIAWNDPDVGVQWPQVVGEYKGSASAEGYTLEDGTALNLSEKDQKLLSLRER